MSRAWQVIAFSADCTPVLLLDPVRRAVGAVHAGWRGTAAGIVLRAVEQMQKQYGTPSGGLAGSHWPVYRPVLF